MKKIVVILVMLSIGFTYAQKERTLVLNEDTDLIEVTYYHEDGKISQTGFYTKDGKLQGEWYTYCKEGNKLTSAKYHKGMKVGKWFYWRGDQLKEVDYDKGKIVAVSDWKNAETIVASNK